MNERALKVLEQYELEVGQLRRGRGSYMFDTPQGFGCCATAPVRSIKRSSRIV
mgnify:CR=1 FL=1